MTDREDELDPNSPADRENFGEASLGEAATESDPDPFDERDAYEEEEEIAEAAGEGLTDVPSFAPDPSEAILLE